jgi:Tfp pilus assembly pilus retraction ATPase PilT
MQTGGDFGMQTMDMALAQLVRTGWVTLEAALDRCHDPVELQRLL